MSLVTALQAQAVENAHAHDLDFNPQKQHIFATAGDESQIRIWDRRMLGVFLLELPGHSHWTWRVRYNPKCDEFLLTQGDYSSDTGIATMADRPDDVTEEVSSSQGQQTHEVGESSRPPQTEDEIFRTQLVTAVAMFTQVMQNPRFMAFLQPLPLSQSIGNKKAEPAKAQPHLIHTTVSMETPVHLPETMQSPNPVHNVQEQVAGTPVLQAAPVQPATFQQPLVGSNGQGSDLQAMQQVFPPPSIHPGYFGGGLVFHSIGHAPGSTDSLVNLWTVGASCEDKSGARSPEDSPRAHTEPILRSYNGHEDSVYGIAWSSKEPWIFASLSYDGRVVFIYVLWPAALVPLCILESFYDSLLNSIFSKPGSLSSPHNTRSQRRASTHTRTRTATNEDDEDFQDSDPASEEDDDEVLEDVVVEEVLADEEDILDDDEEA
ncbi:hypothetical protein L7F22_066585 [Adiantum nelumboides]|nr:hypothetical protein [Adiantum nelumboides]